MLMKTDNIQVLKRQKIVDAMKIINKLKKPIIIFVDISKYIKFKIEAFNCYKSQVQKHPYPRNLKALKSLSIFRGTSCGFKNAEAFETLFSID